MAVCENLSHRSTYRLLGAESNWVTVRKARRILSVCQETQKFLTGCSLLTNSLSTLVVNH